MRKRPQVIGQGWSLSLVSRGKPNDRDISWENLGSGILASGGAMWRLLIFAFLLIAGATPAQAVILPVPSYKQCDPAWGSLSLGTASCSLTICSHGCAVTSAAMVFRYYGGTYNPGQLNTCLRNNGGFNGCYIVWTACRPSGVTYHGSFSGSQVAIRDRVNAELNAGRPVIAYVIKSGQSTPSHFVVITGNNNGQFQMNDPGRTAQTISAAGYTISSLRLYSGTPSVCACTPGQTQTGNCGNCGTMNRTCGSNCQWGSWSSCSGQGICSPGQTQSQACCDCGTQSRSCTASCQWAAWSQCQGQDPVELIPCETGEPGVCDQGRIRCVQGCYSCARLVEPSPEICDGLDNDCNGLVDDGSPSVMGEPPPAYAAALVDLSYPARLEPGERGMVWVVFENVGTATWGVGDIWLQALAPEEGAGSLLMDQESWPAHDVVAVLTQDVEPGEYAEFFFDLRFPQNTQGPVVERFRLLSPLGVAINCPSSELEVSVAPARASNVPSPSGDDTKPEENSLTAPGPSQERMYGGCHCRAMESTTQGSLSLLGIALLLAYLRLRRRRWK